MLWDAQLYTVTVRSPQRWKPWMRSVLPVATIIAGVVLVYLPSLRNGFVGWDDNLLITENSLVRGVTWEHVKAAFTRYDPELYIPLTFLSYQLDYAIWGMNPFGFHITNLIFHAANAALVFFLLVRLLKRFQPDSSQAPIIHFPFGPLFVALLWAIHPLNTEAVVWASARKDVLSAFFFLLSLSLYLRSDDAPQSWSLLPIPYLLSFLSFFFGLLSKVTIATGPGVMLLIDWTTHRPVNRRRITLLLPFVVLSIIFLIVAAFGKETGTSFAWEKALIGTKAFWFYLGKIAVPVGFSVLYPYTRPIALSTPDLFLSASGVLILVAATLMAYRRRKHVVVLAILWYIALLVPTFNTIAKGHDELQDVYFASDRYPYIASIGVFLLIGFFLRPLYQWRGVHAIIISLAVILGGLTMRQSLVWRDTPSLFRHVLAYYPNSHVAHTNVGVTLFQEGNIEGAMAEFRRALAIRPNGMAYYNIGQIHLLREEPEEAMESFRRAIDVSPMEVDSYLYLSALLINRARFEEAERVLAAMFGIHPQNAQLYAKLGLVRARQGRWAEAHTAYQRALQLDPENVDVQRAIGELEEGRN